MLTPTSFPRSNPELIGGGSLGASVADVGFASTNPGRAISALGRARLKLNAARPTADRLQVAVPTSNVRYQEVSCRTVATKIGVPPATTCRLQTSAIG